jgi:hypothetical protein
MDGSGRLSGPELICTGGSRYRAGDSVVTLAPGADGRLVTSQRAVVTAVDPSAETLTLRTDDGQQTRLSGEEAGCDRLVYGYATTVHRCQGSTTERAHLFADGGGRELAYVAMSRARQSTHVWTVADDLPQAVDDLRRDWSTPRTPAWAMDTALPDPATLTREQFQALPSDQQAGVTALLHAETFIAGSAIVGIGLPDRAATLGQAEAALNEAKKARADLETGRGLWQATQAGRAVRDLAQARDARDDAERATTRGLRWRDRLAARKQAAIAAEREAEAERRWQTHVAPEIARLDQQIVRHESTLRGAATEFERQQGATNAVLDHALAHQRAARSFNQGLAAERARIDGVPTAAEIRWAGSQQRQLQGLTRTPEPEVPEVSHGGPLF